VFINDRLQDALSMQVGSDGTCYFPEAHGGEEAVGDDLLAHHLRVRACEQGRQAGAASGAAGNRRLQPDAATLAKLDLEAGRNEVRYEVMGQTSLMQTTVSLFLWTSDDPVVVLHVETAVMKRAAVLAKGTQTLSFGRHSGQSLGWESPWPYACELMVYFDTAGYRLVLLTSTPITWCDKVRQRLSAIRGRAGRKDDDDDELRLPAAALLSSSQRSFTHAVNSLVAEAGSFQSEALSQVLAAFGLAGREVSRRLGAADEQEDSQHGSDDGEDVKREAEERAEAGEGPGQDDDARAAVPKVAAIGAFGAAAILHSLAPNPFSLRRRTLGGGRGESAGWGEDPGGHAAGDRGQGSRCEYQKKARGRRKDQGGLVGAFGDGKIDPCVFGDAGIDGGDIFCVSEKGAVSSHDSTHGPFDSYKAMLRHLPELFPPVRGRHLMPAFTLPAQAGWGDGSGGRLEHKGMGGATYRTNAVPHGSRFNRVDAADLPEEAATQPRSTYKTEATTAALSGRAARGRGGGADDSDDEPQDGPEDACEWVGADGCESQGVRDADSSDSSDSEEDGVVQQPATRRRVAASGKAASAAPRPAAGQDRVGDAAPGPAPQKEPACAAAVAPRMDASISISVYTAMTVDSEDGSSSGGLGEDADAKCEQQGEAGERGLSRQQRVTAAAAGGATLLAGDQALPGTVRSEAPADQASSPPDSGVSSRNGELLANASNTMPFNAVGHVAAPGGPSGEEAGRGDEMNRSDDTVSATAAERAGKVVQIDGGGAAAARSDDDDWM